MNYIVTVNGKKYEVEVEKVDGGRKTLSRQPMGRTERREVEREVKETEVKREEVKSEVSSSNSGTLITSPMPGSILDIKVSVGQKVKYGECLAVLEAMKMENDIPATVDGEVVEIKVKKGDIVETDAVLIVLK